jgi:hypothetical protein
MKKTSLSREALMQMLTKAAKEYDELVKLRTKCAAYEQYLKGIAAHQLAEDDDDVTEQYNTIIHMARGVLKHNS